MDKIHTLKELVDAGIKGEINLKQEGWLTYYATPCNEERDIRSYMPYRELREWVTTTLRVREECGKVMLWENT